MYNENYEVREQYANWLSGESWDYFFTGTFGHGDYSPNGARRAAERFFRGFPTKELAVLFIESGSLYGKVHLHGLLRFRSGQRPTARTIWARWFDKYGRARVEAIESAEAVSNYRCKYVTKHMKDETFIVL
jgi:hypothetical protein